MATSKSLAPSPARDKPKVWEAPDSDQEFVFEGMDSVPGWIDKSWAGFSRGPALALPSDLLGDGPYTTRMARIGDTVVFKKATPSKPAHFDVVEGEPTGENATKKPPQQTAASLEDMIKTGFMTPDDLGPIGREEVASRSPKLRTLLMEGKNAPEAIPVEDVVKLS
jgi:hypothetical protein